MQHKKHKEPHSVTEWVEEEVELVEEKIEGEADKMMHADHFKLRVVCFMVFVLALSMIYFAYFAQGVNALMFAAAGFAGLLLLMVGVLIIFEMRVFVTKIILMISTLVVEGTLYYGSSLFSALSPQAETIILGIFVAFNVAMIAVLLRID